MSAREDAERVLDDAAQLQGRPELQEARAAVAQGHALLAIADAVERFRDSFIEQMAAVGAAAEDTGRKLSKLNVAMKPSVSVDQALVLVRRLAGGLDITDSKVAMRVGIDMALAKATAGQLAEVRDAEAVLVNEYGL
jgi:hypothetical protein